MRLHLIIGLAGLTFMVGCATTYPVVTVSKATGERFYGKAISSIGVSTFELKSATGVTCTGTYEATVVLDYSTGSTTDGKMTCSDGRTGTWVTSGTAVGGQGEGQIGNDIVRIYYGQFAAQQQIN